MILNPPAVRGDLLRAQLHLLLLAVEHATPGPWDSRAGWVVGPPLSPSRSRFSLDEKAVEYYGGELVCESVGRADAVVIAAARNLMPQLLVAHQELLDENERLARECRWLRMDNDELRARETGGGLIGELRADLDRCRERLQSLASHAAEVLV